LIVKTKKPFAIAALFLAFVVLASSVGVAQVSHICKLALAGKEQQSCKTETTGDHACCADQADQTQSPEKDPCCSNEVKVFSQEVISTVPATGKTLPVEVAVISLITAPLFPVDEFTEWLGSFPEFSSWRIPESDIMLFNCTLLI
jgi:hypothetical protein